MHPYYYEKLAGQRHQELTAAATAYRIAHEARAELRPARARNARWGRVRRAVLAFTGPGRTTTVVTPRALDLEATGRS